MSKLPEIARKEFEEQIFGEYFVSQVQRTGLGGPLEFLPSKDIKTKAELLTRDPKDGEDYADEAISAMWFGWRLAAKHLKGVV